MNYIILLVVVFAAITNVYAQTWYVPWDLTYVHMIISLSGAARIIWRVHQSCLQEASSPPHPLPPRR